MELNNPYDNCTFKILSSLPHAGEVTVTFTGEKQKECELALRVPGWADGLEIWFNEEKSGVKQSEDGYLHIKREWQDGDTIKILFGMKIRINYANPRIRQDIGKVAVSRGPLIYCMEEADNGKELQRLLIDTESELKTVPDIYFEDTVDIIAEGIQLENTGWGEKLYAADTPPEYKSKSLRFIPYYLWNNRGRGEMAVWVRTRQ